MAVQDRAFAGNNGSAARWFAQQPGWWREHYHDAVDQALDFITAEGIRVDGAQVLDLGCGDGIISLGLLRHGKAAAVTAVDLVPADLAFLCEQARRNGVAAPSPEEPLHFRVSQPNVIPAAAESFDIVTAWSVFEHVAQPAALLAEIRRVLRPGAVLFLQIWPMWNSEHGSHLWPWFDEPFAQLRLSPEQIAGHLSGTIAEAPLAAAMLDLYHSCNQVTIDELQAAIVEQGFYLAKAEVTGGAFHVPPALQGFPLSKMGITGIKILAVRQ